MRFTRIGAATAVALLMAVLTACGSPTPEGNASRTSEAGSFPVTIEHAYGETVIEKEPTRVATLGWLSGDVVYSYGVTPVAIEADRWAGDDGGFTPWFREALEADNVALPVTYDVYPEIDLDALIEAEPDVILAPLSGITQEQYDQLSQLAPTVAYRGDAWTTPWTEVIEMIGETLGQPEKATELIAGMAEITDAAASEHPEFADLSFAYVYAGLEPGTLAIYQDGDARVDLVTALGLKEVPALAELPSTAGQFTTSLGLENADQLKDVDVLFTWFNDEAEAAATAAQPLWAQIPAVQRGSTVTVLDRQLGMATTAVTPLSLPWSIERFVPLVEEAVTKVG